MGGTDFYFIDSTETRFVLGHMGTFLDAILASLQVNPQTHDELDRVYKGLRHETLYEKKKYRRIHQNASIEEIRLVTGWKTPDENKVRNRWQKEYYSHIRKMDNFDTLPQNSSIHELIPPIDEEMIKEAKRDGYRSVKTYRRDYFTGYNGTVVIDLPKKIITYCSRSFTIAKRSKMINEWKYRLNDEWTIKRE